MRFSVRQYRPEDFVTLWNIDQACFPPGISYTRGELASYIRRSTAFTLVAERLEDKAAHEDAPLRRPADEEGGKILAFVVAEVARSAGHIITIDVRADARRARVGSTLLAAAEEHLSLSGCHIVRLETAVDNSSALSFYKRHGYNVAKIVPRYYSNGLDALLLEKHLLSRLPTR